MPPSRSCGPAGRRCMYTAAGRFGGCGSSGGRGEAGPAVPALAQIEEQAGHGGGDADPLGQHARHLADGGERRPRRPRHPQQPAHCVKGAHRRRAVGVGQRAEESGEDLARSPVGNRDEVGRERVAKDLGGDVGVGRAAGVREHAGVVGLRGRLGIEPEAIGESGRDQGALQPVLERETHAGVGRQAQRPDHLRGADELGALERLVRQAPTLNEPGHDRQRHPQVTALEPVIQARQGSATACASPAATDMAKSPGVRTSNQRSSDGGSTLGGPGAGPRKSNERRHRGARAVPSRRRRAGRVPARPARDGCPPFRLHRVRAFGWGIRARWSLDEARVGREG
jgi:hypothetical protein